MNILLSSRIDSKFFNDIALAQDNDLTIYAHNIENQLYKLYSKIKPKFLFVNIFELNEEINQFAIEYEHECVVFCYCPNTNYYQYDVNFNADAEIVYLCYQDDLIPNRRCLTIPKNIVNKRHLSYLLDQPKDNNIVCFLDGIHTENKQKLISLLYPNNKDFNIRLFNDTNLQHPQNLGIVSHIDKLELLAKNKYVICNQGYEYYYESIFLSCKPIHIEKIGDNLSETINRIEQTKLNDINNIHSFEDFFKEMVMK